MTGITMTADFYGRGFDKYELGRLVRSDQLVRIRRGVYADPPEEPTSLPETHRRLIASALPLLDPTTVVSHGSAAVLHGIPSWLPPNASVHVTRPRSGGGQRRRLVHLNTAPLAPSDVALLEGVAVTSLARTVLDLARTLPLRQAVASGDRALANGLEQDELRDVLGRMVRWPGVRAARRACGLLDVHSESVGESFSRVLFVERGIPAPQPQYEVYDEAGFLLARSDFGWEDQRTLGEFDGKVKYGKLVRQGRTSADVVFDEKCREDDLRDRGWQVVRWIWDDLQRPDVVQDRLLRAFARTAATAPSSRARLNPPVIRRQ